MNKYSNILIDTNNYFHKHYAVVSKYSKDIYKETGRKVFNGIKSIENKYGGKFCKVYCLFDNHDSKINLRSELSEDYKKNRQTMPSKFYDTLEQVKSMLLSYKDNYKIVYADYLEADDLVLPLVESIGEYSSILMISEDQDWARLVNYKDRHIHWLKSHKILDKYAYKEEYGYYPSLQSVVLYKTIRGDTSDGIKPSVPNLKEETLLQICKTFVDAYDLIQNVNKVDFISDHFKDVIKRESANIIRNHKLVSFIALPEMKESIRSYIFDGSYKEQSLRMFYKIFDIDYKEDNRIQYQKNTALFHLDTMPRR